MMKLYLVWPKAFKCVISDATLSLSIGRERTELVYKFSLKVGTIGKVLKMITFSTRAVTLIPHLKERENWILQVSLSPPAKINLI